jgi:uncharacterized protein YkwD
MRLRILSCLLLLAVSFDAAANNLYTTINRLRAGDGNCAVAGNLPPLRPQSALERVARDLAHGNKLESSLQAAGYRAERSIAFSGRGDDVGAQAEAMLARQSACRQLQDGTMTEVGVYLDARQFWIVLAAPHLQLAPQTSHSPLAPVISTREQAVGHRILDLINQARARPRYCGNQAFNAAPPVRWNEALAASSLQHSEDMARNDYFDHISPRDGSHSWERLERAGYRYSTTGENIAAGYDNAEEAVAGWLKSPGHCANLMNPAFVDMGAALAVNRSSKMGSYWTQEFGRPL